MSDAIHRTWLWVERCDLTLLHLTLSIAAGLAALWVMQCLTRQAGLHCGQRAPLALRLSLAGLSIAMMLDGVVPMMEGVPPRTSDVFVSAFVLLTLITVPRLWSADHPRRA